MKKIIQYFSLFVLLFSLLFLFSNWNKFKNITEKTPINNKKSLDFDNRLSIEANNIKNFVKSKKDYNDEIVFLVDMKIASNKNRFYIYDLKEDKIIDKGLVAHGSGSEKGRNNKGELYFSNENNSLCTSLGKYEIKNSYNGDFGKAYRLKGLDKTNSNAIIRFIVLHKYEDVPEKEQFDPICLSWGCPMVNEIFFQKLEKIIDNSNKTILLYIYY